MMSATGGATTPIVKEKGVDVIASTSSSTRAGRSAHNRARALKVEHLKKSLQVGASAAAVTAGVTWASFQDGTGSLAASCAAGVASAVWWSRKPSGAASWTQGANAEERTAATLAPLVKLGWWVGHDRSIPRSRANLDHIAIHPSGRFLVYVDTKAWHAKGAAIQWDADSSRLLYGKWDQTKAMNTVKWEARRLSEETGLPVLPVIAVDGGRVIGNKGSHAFIDAADMYIVSSNLLFHTMALMDKVTGPNTAAVARVRRLVDSKFPPAQ